MPERPAVICLTPVRNERWILDKFLRATSVWADHIIIADQNSSDGSREIAARCPKVRLVENQNAAYDEASRRELLMAEARRISGPRLIFGLDADELLCANLLESPEWSTLLRAPPGTHVGLQWVNLFATFGHCHVFQPHGIFAYMDDGRAIEGTFIHSPRVPVNPAVPGLYLAHGKVLHYQYLDWARMKAKHRWYECLEHLKYPGKSPTRLYRQYHHMDVSWARKDAVDWNWFRGYEHRGIDVTSIEVEPHPYFEAETLKLLAEHGAARFRRLAIWDVNWVDLARYHQLPDPERFRDPRSKFQRAWHRWLRRSQDRAHTRPYRLLDRIFDLFGR